MGSNLVISLDFELNWGVRKSLNNSRYRNNIIGARLAIPKILSLFSQYGIHATFATVGMLAHRSKNELLKNLIPIYSECVTPVEDLYRYIHSIGNNEEEDPLHYAPSLIKQILRTDGMEIGSHTYTHLYCIEDRVTDKIFKLDHLAFLNAFDPYDCAPKSLVFPRNQYSNNLLFIAKQNGIIAYRGNQSSWMFKDGSRELDFIGKRFGRFIDSYFQITNQLHVGFKQDPDHPINICANQFLRPYSPKCQRLNRMQFNRIISSMEKCAKFKRNYHLWWHPHNFGANITENIRILDLIISRFSELRNQYGMQSLNMSEVALTANL